MNVTTYDQDGWPTSMLNNDEAARIEQLESAIETLLLDQLEGDNS